MRSRQGCHAVSPGKLYRVSKKFINLGVPSEAATEKYFHFVIVLTVLSQLGNQHDSPKAN
jgi:hypothetical protein